MFQAAHPYRDLLRSVGSLTLLRLASMGIAFFIGIALARQLGASGYGTYGLAMAVATLAGMAAEFGLPTLALREVANAKARNAWNLARGLEIWSTRFVLLLSAALAGIIFAVNSFTGLSTDSEFMAALLWAALLIPAVAIGKLRGMALLSLGRTVAGQLPVLVLRPGFFLLALAAAWALQYEIEASTAMALQVGATFLATLVAIAAWRRFRPGAMGEATPVSIAWLPT